MFQVAVELVIALTLTGVTTGLSLGRRRIKPHHRDYDLLLIGFCLLTCGAWLDVADLQARFPEGSVTFQTLVFIEMVGGYFLGILFIASGLSSWVSALIRYQDATDARLRSEERLRTAEKRLALHVQHMPLGAIEWDLEFHVRAWNPAAERIFGHTAAQAIGQPATLIIAATERPEVEDVMQRLEREAESLNHRNLNVRKDGRKITCEWYNTRLIDNEGQLIGYASLVQDITEHVEAENALNEEKNLVRSLLDGAPGIFYMFDRRGHIVRWNHQYEAVYGYTGDEIRRLQLTDMVAPRDREPAARIVERAFTEGKFTATLSALTKDGRTIPHYATGTLVETAKGRFIAGIAIDISARVSAEEALLESKRLAEQRNESLHLLNRLADRLHRTLEIDSIAEETIGALLQMDDPPLAAFYLLEPDGTSLRLRGSHGFDGRVRRAGSLLPVSGSLSGIALTTGQVTFVEDIADDDRLEPTVKELLVNEGIVSALLIPLSYDKQALGSVNLVYKDRRELDVAAREIFRAIGKSVSLAVANARHVQGLKHMALHDSLTGLPNRAHLHTEFDRIAARAKDDFKVALLLLDLDRFKEVNDTLGHHVGDRLLIHVGRRAREALSNHRAVVARLGGDEFSVLLLNVAGADDSCAIAMDLREALKQPFTVNGMTLEVGASVGVAICPEHGRNSHDLLRCADVAMYQAKQTTGGVSLYRSEFDHHTPERLTMMGELGTAIREDQLLLHFQPTVSLSDRRLMGFEALVRWQHPGMGMVFPAKFIPLAEMSDLIHPLTDWVVDHSLAQLRRWQDQGLDASMAINLSTRNLLNRDWARRMEGLIDGHDVRPERIELEITETALLGDPERALELLDHIASLGVRLSIDDFGTGYSSLSYLKRLPVSTLKIDRSFVRDMIDNDQDRVIVRSTINLAHSLGLRVLAEGVEDQDTLEALGTLDCDLAQGYHIARPMAADTFDGWLAENPQWIPQPIQ